MAIQLIIPSISQHGKPSLVIFLIQHRLSLIHISPIVKASGSDKVDWSLFYPMGLMELDLNIRAVEFKDFYKWLTVMED